jgi:hypothetical protein
VVLGAERKTAQVVLFLKYMITRKEGEKLSLEIGRLDTFGLSLSIEPSLASFDVMWEDGKPYWVIKSIYDYADYFDDTPSFRVCLMQGGKVLDARTIGLQYEVKSYFDFGKRIDGINGKIDGISGTVRSLDGKVSGFETTIDHFRTEVKDKMSRSELEQTAEGIAMKVSSCVNANLLWGSDFDLDGVDTTNKRAIQKHLGVGLSEIKVGDAEYFQYLKGGGLAGADAIRIKNVYERDDWAKWTNISWHDVPLKPNTQYTISVWVKFKSYGKKGCMYIDCSSDDGRYNFGGFLYKEHYFDKADIDEWQRVRYVFDSGSSKKMSSLFLACIADEKEGAQCELWLCRPKLEEGDMATPWCAYDGTVEALLAGGFDIKNRKFTATADNFKVQNNRGKQTLLVDENGKLNTELIDATEIYGMKIAQPFEAYASKKEMKNGKSLSWVLENWSQDYGFFGGRERMNGVTSNIFNNTGSTVSFWMPLITPFKYCQVDIPNNVMLRAVAIYRTQWDGCRWYLLCPWEDNGSGGVRLKAFNG